MKVHLILAGALCCSFAACDDKKENAEAKAPAPKTVHSCKIIVAAKAGEPETFKGEATAADEQEAEDKAWEAACAELPEADRASCRDNDKFSWSASGMSAQVDGETQYTKAITLKRVVKPEEFSAEVESEESSDNACAEALAKACKDAGADGDCVAAGTHEERGRMASTETK